MKNKYTLISENFEINHQLEFYSQGSFVMDTIITTKDEDYDLDDGVYFLGNLNETDRPPTTEFHNWVIEAVGQEEYYGEVSDKDTCVRVRYNDGFYDESSKSFHIDLPIYYAQNVNCPDLAHNTKSWIPSNPIKFIAWFEGKVESGFKEEYLLESKLYEEEFAQWYSDIRKNDTQLRRIVRFLKAWGDHKRGNMPPGIIMTILGAENYIQDNRDDIALQKTLLKIWSYFENNEFKCLRPTEPKGEDLFANYNKEQKEYFKKALKSFIESANQAIHIPNQREACYKWQLHLGDRFSCGLAVDSYEDADQYKESDKIMVNAKSS